MKRETIDQASAIYAEYHGQIPTDREITNLYYEYSKNWRQYKGFADWLFNQGY